MNWATGLRAMCLAAMAGIGLVAAVDRADAAAISAVSASGTGTFNNSPDLIIDGFIPAEASVFNAATNVHWSTTVPAFTIDLGGIFLVDDLLLSLDNNDTYRVSVSTDGVGFSTLFDVLSGFGEIGVGMDTFSTDSTNPEYIAALDFTATSMRYIRVAAIGGDNLYSIGEVQAFGSAANDIPEPGMVGLFAMGLLGLAVARQRRRR